MLVWVTDDTYPPEGLLDLSGEVGGASLLHVEAEGGKVVLSKQDGPDGDGEGGEDLFGNRVGAHHCRAGTRTRA